MPPRKKIEPNPKVESFISRTDNNSSSEDEPLEIVVQRVRKVVEPIPVVEPVVVEPIKKKVVRKPRPKTAVLPPIVEPTPIVNDTQQELKALREELALSKKKHSDTHNENISLRRNEIDLRRQAMVLRFN